jgi:multidrug efflux system membrane fusion protein
MNNFTALAIVKNPLFQASVITTAFVLWMASGVGKGTEQQNSTVVNHAMLLSKSPFHMCEQSSLKRN